MYSKNWSETTVKWRDWHRMLVFGILFTVIVGCAGMDVQETYYLAVPSGENTNFYRVRVSANATNGVSNYDAAWFSVHSVDALYSDVTSSTAAAELNVEKNIRDTLNAQIESAYQSYLEAAADPTKTNTELAPWLNVLKRLRAAPGSNTPLPGGAIEMEYNPAENLVTRRAGQKLVMVLSSDPDDVIAEISNFSQSTETSASVLRLGEVFTQQQNNQAYETEAEMNAVSDDFVLLAAQLEAALNDSEQADKDALIQRLISLITLAESIQ